MLLSNLNSSSNPIPGNQILSVTLFSAKNPPSTATSDKFALTLYYNNHTGSTVSTGSINGINDITMDIIDVTKVVISPSSDLVLDSKVNYTISFVIGNDISVGGFIVVTIPIDIKVDISNISNNCKISINSTKFISTPCIAINYSNGTLINFTASAPAYTIVEGSTISLQVLNSFTNPPTTLPVSNFTIRTYYGDSYPIEQTFDPISVQVKTPLNMTSMSVIRNSSLNSDPYSAYTIIL